MSKNWKIYIYVFKLAIKKVLGKKSIFWSPTFLDTPFEKTFVKFEHRTSKSEKVIGR